MTGRIACAIAAVAAVSHGAAADLIVFIHTGGPAAGTLAGVPFSAPFFRITAFGDTAARYPLPDDPGFAIDHQQVIVQISGVGAFALLTPTRTFVNRHGSSVGFSRAGEHGTDLYNGPENAAFLTWTMLDSVGPIGGETELLQWGSQPRIQTSGGEPVFDTAVTTGTFEAVVPAPGAGGIVALAGAWGVRRRRR